MQFADPTLTPGDWTQEGFTERNVTSAVKNQVFAAYKIGRIRRILYVIDHLIPLEIGGTNDIKNLWPQPRREAKQKDFDENVMRFRIRSGTYTREQAVNYMLQNWRKGYPVA